MNKLIIIFTLLGCSVFGQVTDSSTLCIVTGKLRKANLLPVVGADIWAMGVTGSPSVATIGTTSTIIIDIPVSTYTDTTGAFTMYLMKSSTLTPSTNSTYRIKGSYNGEAVFELAKATIPALSTVSLTDLISGFVSSTDSTKLCLVSGRLRRPDLTNVAGAYITVSTVGFSSPSITTQSDSLGAFSFSLVWSSQFVRPTSSWYTIDVNYGEELFTIPKLSIPSISTLDITDSLSVRLAH